MSNAVLNALGAISNFAMSGMPIVSATARYERVKTCFVCDSHDPRSGQCKECSCFIKIKSWAATEDCPLGKWPKIELPVIKNPAGDSAKLATPATPQETPPKRRGCCG